MAFVGKNVPVRSAHKISISREVKKQLKRIAVDHEIGVGELMGSILKNFVDTYQKDEVENSTK